MGRYKFAFRDNVVRSIEPVMFMHAVSALLVSTVYSSLRLDKVCRVGSDWFGNGKCCRYLTIVHVISWKEFFKGLLTLKNYVMRLTMGTMKANKTTFNKLQTNYLQQRHTFYKCLRLFLF